MNEINRDSYSPGDEDRGCMKKGAQAMLLLSGALYAISALVERVIRRG